MIKEDIDLPTKQIPEWVVGNGKSINLWYDNWIDNDPISSKFNHFHFSENDLVSDLISDDEWLIPSQLPGSLQEFLSQATNLIPLGIPPAPDSLFWKNSSGKLSLQEAWNLLRTPDSIKTWSSLIWNNLLNPRLACHSWRLMHRRTPTEIWAKSKGWSMASRCHNCFIDEESDLHLFFSCSLAQKFWAWLLSPCEVRFLYPISASSIWHSIAKDADVLGRKCAASIFFHAIFILWQLRNDSKHNSRLPNLERAKVLFLDRLKSMVNSATGCCFVKFATSEEADKAIRALHNQVTLPGGLGPIQVRYADGERERFGNFPNANGNDGCNVKQNVAEQGTSSLNAESSMPPKQRKAIPIGFVHVFGTHRMEHTGSVKSLSSHPSNSDILVSGSKDESFALCDLRSKFSSTTGCMEACFKSVAVVKELMCHAKENE